MKLITSLLYTLVALPVTPLPDKAWPVLCKLLHKACERLRAGSLLAGSLTLQPGFVRGPSWSADAHTVETDSTHYGSVQESRDEAL